MRHTLGCLLAGQTRRGPHVERFEDELAERLEGRRPRVVGSGRLALLLVLDALGIERGSTVLLPAYNASCVPNVLQAAGYGLHFVDIRPDTLHLDVGALPETPPPDLKAIVVTHIEGSPAPMAEVLAWARTHGLVVIEDAAHALGATLDGQPVGTLADGAIFSLGRGKHLNTLGGGMAIVSGDEAHQRLDRSVEALPRASAFELLGAVFMEGMVETGTTPAIFGLLALPVMRLARRFGRDPMTALFEDDKSPLQDIPAPMRRRLTNLQARFGLEALLDFDRTLARRRDHAGRLREALGDVLRLQQPIAGADPAWLELTALVDDRDGFQSALLARGIDTQRTWMDACDELEAFDEADGGPCEHARDVAARAVYLPTYASLTEAQVDGIIEVVQQAAATPQVNQVAA